MSMYGSQQYEQYPAQDPRSMRPVSSPMSRSWRLLTKQKATNSEMQHAIGKFGVALLDENGCLIDVSSIAGIQQTAYDMVMDNDGNVWQMIGSQVWQLNISLAGQYVHGTLNYPYLPTYPPNYAPLRREPLPVRQQQDTYIAYKTLKIAIHDESIKLVGLQGKPYDVDAVAECAGHANDEKHRPPHEGCACGFYALIKKPVNWEYGAFRAQVELFGRVIRGQLGYKAERQRVLSMEAKKECCVCKEDAVGFSTNEKGQVFAVCKKHSMLAAASPAELAAHLGTEVRWMGKVSDE